MDYKDEVSRNTAIKKEHLTELSTAITALATHASIAVDVSKMTYEKVNSVNVKLLQSAIHTLEKGFSENCCEANWLPDLSGGKYMPVLSGVSRMSGLPKVSDLPILSEMPTVPVAI